MAILILQIPFTKKFGIVNKSVIWKKNYRLKIFNFYQQLVPTFKLKYNPSCDFLSLKTEGMII